MIDTISGKVTNSLTLETASCSSATMAEKDAFVLCLEEAKENFSANSPLETVTTDGNISIRSFMEKQNEVIHALDLWHFVKNLRKNLAKKCKNVHQRQLLPWVPHIANHVWWSAASCEQNEEILREMVFSMAYHVIDKHTDFDGHKLFTSCAHEPITREEHEELDFLKPGSEAQSVLYNHIRDKHFLKQLSLTTHGQHTGRLEVLHSMMLAYVPKRIDFDPPAYQGRVQLAILDHNENVDRPVLMRNDEEVLRLVWSKAVKDYRLKKVYSEKTFMFRQQLMEDVVERAAKPLEPTAKYTGQTIATKDKPDKAEARELYYRHRRM